jgi:hypothetical protein
MNGKNGKTVDMEKEFIPYPLALRMKQIGFNEPCIGFATMAYKDVIHCDIKFKVHKESDLPTKPFGVPTWQSAFRWFREKYNLVHEISWSKYKGGLNFDYDVFSLVLPTDDELGDEDDIASDKSMETYDSLIDKDFRHKESDTYEEAETACLTKLIEIVEQKYGPI